MKPNIGTILHLRADTDLRHFFDKLDLFGLKTCQICCWDMHRLQFQMQETVEILREEMERRDIHPSAWWAGYSGRVFWNFTEGPITLGLVPPAYRVQRIHELCLGADIAKALELPAIITHCGFIPENLTDPEYPSVVLAIAEVARYCKSLGLQFWFETGQETPTTLLRTIQRLENFGCDNLGINLDPANLLLYGKGNPIDALDVFGKYVRNIHVKDGRVPTDGERLGNEMQVGEGMVNYPRFLAKLKEIGFDGAFIIERELSESEEKNRDILATVQMLRRNALIPQEG